MPVAAYARYSTDSQRETSIEDQLMKCADIAKARNLHIDPALVFTDSALKGTSQHTTRRKGYQQLLAAWEAGLVDVVIADELCRIVRDVAEGGLLMQRVMDTGVHVITADGIDTRVTGWELQWQVRLMIAFQEVRSTSDRTKRSMRGVLERGGMIAAPPYGYRIDWTKSEPGLGHEGARWAIDPVESGVVQEIFAMRRSGRSVNSIARELNARGLLPPRASQAKGQPFWRGASISRMVCNSIYKGEFSYGGSAWTRHLAKKRRKKLEVKVFSRPHFRLVSDELWSACNPERKEERV